MSDDKFAVVAAIKGVEAVNEKRRKVTIQHAGGTETCWCWTTSKKFSGSGNNRKQVGEAPNDWLQVIGAAQMSGQLVRLTGYTSQGTDNPEITFHNITKASIAEGADGPGFIEYGENGSRNSPSANGSQTTSQQSATTNFRPAFGPDEWARWGVEQAHRRLPADVTDPEMAKNWLVARSKGLINIARRIAADLSGDGGGE